jgi:hypothetical protein
MEFFVYRYLFAILIALSLTACDEDFNPFKKKEPTVEEQLDQAKAELDHKNYGKSVEITVKITGEDPKNYQAYYVESQAQTLIGAQKEAIEALKQAMENGFKDFKALEDNKNFDNIRDSKAYRALLKKYDPDYSAVSIKSDDIDVDGEVSIKNVDGKQVIKAGDVSISLPN